MKIFMRIIVVLIMCLFAHNAWALTIISPKEGEEFYAGSELTIIVEPAPGEKWENVAFGFYPMLYNPIANKYTYPFTLPAQIQGYYDRLIVIGVDNAGNEVELKRKVFVKLPANVVLQGIKAGSKVAYGSTLVLLRKMPEGSSLADREKYEKAEIRVDGQYSDGVKRKLNSSASGTTYTISDETVATVDKEGKLTAQKLGETKITVKNGNYSATVDVIVKPYKK